MHKLFKVYIIISLLSITSLISTNPKPYLAEGSIQDRPWARIKYNGSNYEICLYSSNPLSVNKPFYVEDNVKAVKIVHNGIEVKNPWFIRRLLAIAEIYKYFLNPPRNSILLKPVLNRWVNSMEVRRITDNPLIKAYTRDVRYLRWRRTLYKDVLLTILLGSPSLSNDYDKYLNAVKIILSGLGEKFEVKALEEALNPTSPLLKDIPLSSKVYSKLSEILKGLKRGLRIGQLTAKLLIRLASSQAVEEECVPFLKWLRDEAFKRSKEYHYSELAGVLEEILREREGFWRDLDSVLNVAFEEGGGLIEDTLIKMILNKIGSYLLSKGLCIGAVGTLINSFSLGIGLGLIVGDVLFDVPGVVWERQRWIADSELEYMITEMITSIINSKTWLEEPINGNYVEKLMFLLRLKLLIIKDYCESMARVYRGKGIIDKIVKARSEEYRARAKDAEDAAKLFDEMAGLYTPGIRMLHNAICNVMGVRKKTTQVERVIFSDDFDSYPDGSLPYGWEVVWSGMDYGISSRYSVFGKSFRLRGMDHWTCGVQRTFNSNARLIGYEFDILIESWGRREQPFPDHPGFFCRECATWGAYYASVLFDHKGGVIRAEDGSLLGSWVPGRWYHVKVLLDRRTNAYSVWINGKLAGSNLKTRRNDTYNINAFILISQWSETNVYYDNVRAFEILPAKLLTTQQAEQPH